MSDQPGLFDDEVTELLFRPPPGMHVPGVPDDVTALFERFALQLAGAGWNRYSARAILHRIRWHEHVERGHRSFKCNNNWTPALARWFLERHPEFPSFFELREKADHDFEGD